MMNSVGLENPGVQGFIDKELPDFSRLDTCRIVTLVVVVKTTMLRGLDYLMTRILILLS